MPSSCVTTTKYIEIENRNEEKATTIDWIVRPKTIPIWIQSWSKTHEFIHTNRWTTSTSQHQSTLFFIYIRCIQFVNDKFLNKLYKMCISTRCKPRIDWANNNLFYELCTAHIFVLEPNQLIDWTIFATQIEISETYAYFINSYFFHSQTSS